MVTPACTTSHNDSHLSIAIGVPPEMLLRTALWLAVVCWCAFAESSGQSVDAADRPNIVLVFIDDMGWGDFSCFGNKDASTPHIDRLATEGVRFEQFYVNSPICSPSRTAISTGQYPQRWRITSYLSNRNHNNARGVAQS